MEMQSDEYAERLARRQAFLQRFPSPSAWDLRRLRPGRMLEVGCGTGRQLGFIGGDSVGIDQNPACVERARSSGLNAFTPDDFKEPAGVFDSLLIAHVFEHISPDEGDALIGQYLPYVKRGGQLILIAPQERGYGSDPTHIRFVDLAELRRLAIKAGARVTRAYSFPLPRFGGPLYIGNEFRVTAQLP